MGVHRGKLWMGAAVTGCLLAGVPVGWRAAAQSPGQPARLPAKPAADPPVPVRPTSGDRGNTYHELEREATKVTMRFTDAIAVAERTPEGYLSAKLTDLAGNQLTTVKVRHLDAANDAIDLEVAGGAPRRLARRDGLRPTLDWSNLQAYSLWSDRMGADRAFEWHDTMLRPAGAVKRTSDPEPALAEVEWRGGLSAAVTKKTGTHLSYLTNQKVTGVVYVSRLKRDGVEIGSSQWWPAERVFAWSFPGLTEGYVDDSRLKQAGGWALAPDMAWMNLQNLAFYRFHTAAKSSARSDRPPRGLLARAAALFAPTLSANDVGCDGLHWLDRSVFRPCCDVHDQCYMAAVPPCSWNSWWQWWSSWTCDKCNAMAIVCFATGGTHIYQRFP